MGYKPVKTEVRYVAPLEPLFRVLDAATGEVEQVHSGLNELGQEIPDSVPVAPPVGYRPGPTLQDTILHMLRQQALRVAADTEGFDSPEEADDFDIPDDPLDPLTEYEVEFMPVDELRNRLTVLDRAIKKKEAVDRAAKIKENEDGDTDADEGRMADDTDSVRRSDPKRKGKPKSKQNADDVGGVREADSGTAGPDE